MSRADELRDAFDRGFAAAPAIDKAAALELLRIELAGAPHAIALSDIAGIQVDPKITTLPTTASELIGVMAVRGAIVPVYDLRALLGLSTARAARWVVLAKGLAFAFDAFVGHIAIDEIPVAGVIEHAGQMHPIIDLAAVIAARTKEQR